MAVFRYPQSQTTIVGGATEAKQDVIITELQDVNTELDSQTALLTDIETNTDDVATETTLSALNAKVVAADTTGKATEAKQDTIITELQSIDTNTTDNATETTLAALNAKVTAVDTTDKATETTLAALNAKVTAVDTTNLATSANQTTANASLSNIESDIDDLNARLAGSLVPETFDYLDVTYVAAGNGAGEIETVVYKSGGAAGATVATLTLAYDASNRISSVTRS